MTNDKYWRELEADSAKRSAPDSVNSNGHRSDRSNGESIGRRIERRSDSLSTEGSSSNSCADDDDGYFQDVYGYSRTRIQVGPEHQTALPAYLPDSIDRDRSKIANELERSILVWKPATELTEKCIDSYIKVAFEKYGYNEEQALGMLFWHKYNLGRALSDLANFAPFPDDWSRRQQLIFERAFQFHKKDFHRIRQMLPDKTLADLVKFFYMWKKKRHFTSEMNSLCKIEAVLKNDENSSNESTVSDGAVTELVDSEENNEESNCSYLEDTKFKKRCFNCGIPIGKKYKGPSGPQCKTCFMYWKRTATSRPTPLTKFRYGHFFRSVKCVLPENLNINHDDLEAVASSKELGENDPFIRSTQREIVSVKQQIQKNKAVISKRIRDFPTHLESEAVTITPTEEWTDVDVQAATYAIKTYGSNFEAIAAIVNTKSMAAIREFHKKFHETHKEKADSDDCIKLQKEVRPKLRRKRRCMSDEAPSSLRSNKMAK